jgi:cytochrome P450
MTEELVPNTMTLPPGPKTPVLVQTLQFSMRTYAFLRRCAGEYGDPFTMRLIGNRIYVLISEPSVVREVFAGFNEQAQIEVGNDELRPALGNNSLLLLNGSRHYQHRRILLASFSAASLSLYDCLIRGATERVLRKRGALIPMFDALREVALEAILLVVLGPRPGDRIEELKASITGFVNCVSGPLAYLTFLQRDFGPWSPGGRVFRAKRRVDQMLEEEIEAHRKPMAGQDGGVLSYMLNATDEAGQRFSDEEIHDELITLILAGHDPTTSALAWAMYWIHTDRSVEETLRDEFGRTAEDDPKSWLYLEAVFNETLRICPMFPMVERKLREPVEIMGHVIDPGVRISPCMYLTHHRPELYPEPECFRPERFLKRRFAPHEFYPFGGGGRRCIGASFALHQMKITLATMLRQWRFEPVRWGQVRPILRGASIAPSGELMMRASPLAL